AIDTCGCARGSDPASKLGRLVVEERWIVKHDDNRLGIGSQLAGGSQRKIKPHQLAIVDHLIFWRLEARGFRRDPTTRAADNRIAKIKRVALNHRNRLRQLAADAARALPPVVVVAA